MCMYIEIKIGDEDLCITHLSSMYTVWSDH